MRQQPPPSPTSSALAHAAHTCDRAAPFAPTLRPGSAHDCSTLPSPQLLLTTSVRIAGTTLTLSRQPGGRMTGRARRAASQARGCAGYVELVRPLLPPATAASSVVSGAGVGLVGCAPRCSPRRRPSGQGLWARVPHALSQRARVQHTAPSRPCEEATARTHPTYLSHCSFRVCALTRDQHTCTPPPHATFLVASHEGVYTGVFKHHRRGGPQCIY
jgi:hypothetical protein